MEHLDESSSSLLSRKRRKEEGKLLKRQKIKESGGIRPRKPTDAPSSSENGVSASSSVAIDSGVSSNPRPTFSKRCVGAGAGPKNTPRHSTHSHSRSLPQQQHRFGRVMDQLPCRNKPRFSTVSIALPGSVVSNCQTRELKTILAGQIARAATIYHVDEIIVFNDKLAEQRKPNNHWSNNHKRPRPHSHGSTPRDEQGSKEREPNERAERDSASTTTTATPSSSRSDPHTFLARVLQYCECPQYLRRQFFPMHPDLYHAGLLAPTDAPHHVRVHDHCRFREGVVLDRTVTSTSTSGASGTRQPQKHSLVNCGIRDRPVEINTCLTPGMRCTVELDPADYSKPAGRTNGRTNTLKGTVVSPTAPRERDGTYWGYTVRLASSLQAALDECPFAVADSNGNGTATAGYDLKIGTSERGDLVVDTPAWAARSRQLKNNSSTNNNNSYKHALIVFGGVAGIEECIDADESIRLPGSESHKLFDMWVNVCPYQGSRTIRTEEAVLITLAKLSPMLVDASRTTNSSCSDSTGDSEDEEVALKPMELTDDDPSEESSSEDDE